MVNATVVRFPLHPSGLGFALDQRVVDGPTRSLPAGPGRMQLAALTANPGNLPRVERT